MQKTAFCSRVKIVLLFLVLISFVLNIVSVKIFTFSFSNTRRRTGRMSIDSSVTSHDSWLIVDRSVERDE